MNSNGSFKEILAGSAVFVRHYITRFRLVMNEENVCTATHTVSLCVRRTLFVLSEQKDNLFPHFPTLNICQTKEPISSIFVGFTFFN